MGDKLTSQYRDINKDGAADLILKGSQQIICESEYDEQKSGYKIKLGSVKIERKFLWSSNKHTWVDA